MGTSASSKGPHGGVSFDPPWDTGNGKVNFICLSRNDLRTFTGKIAEFARYCGEA